MATTLAPVDSREVVRCDHCLLVQFRTTNDLCRRCHASLDEEEPEVVMAPPPPQMMPANGNGRGHLNLATSIRSLRLRSGLSQRQLAARMSVPRTYVSKIENEKATPTLSSLERLARALEVTVPDLLSGGERNRQEEIGELMKDQFIAELDAVRVAAERDAVIECAGAGPRLDHAPAPQRVDQNCGRERPARATACTSEDARAHIEQRLLSGQPPTEAGAARPRLLTKRYLSRRYDSLYSR